MLQIFAENLTNFMISRFVTRIIIRYIVTYNGHKVNNSMF